jgi:hypothetical protein
MKKTQAALRRAAALTLATAMIAGCSSKLDQAIDSAKKQAAATGQPQQVVSVDKNGNTTTTTVQPPAPGQTAETVSTTTTPASAVPPGTPPPAPGVYYNPQGVAQPASSSAAPPASGEAIAPAAVQPANVRIPAGTTLAIRINQRISVKTTPTGSRFDGELAESFVDANGNVVLPKGVPVQGVVEASHERGHFKGASILELRLTALTLNGQNYPLATHDLTETKKGKGKRSAAFIGGGTGLGMILGGAAGAGAGTAGAGLTGNRDLDIPAESIVHFRLAQDLTLQG